MKTHDQWIAYFRSVGMENGDIWHLMDGLHALHLVKKAPPRSLTKAEGDLMWRALFNSVEVVETLPLSNGER